MVRLAVSTRVNTDVRRMGKHKRTVLCALRYA